MATLTIFTPAYNRAHTLPRTYESLLAQSCKDFVWLIVDDGSKDNTGELIRAWQEQDNGFEIRYVYKENGGMHTAHNTAYENMDTSQLSSRYRKLASCLYKKKYLVLRTLSKALLVRRKLKSGR